jgi:hypothetical protein
MLVAGNKRIPSLTASDKWRFKMWFTYRLPNFEHAESITYRLERRWVSEQTRSRWATHRAYDGAGRRDRFAAAPVSLNPRCLRQSQI